MLSLILFGGSFDPVHCGHLQIAEAARKVLKADKVIFIPAKNPLWKDPIAVDYRLDMLELAVAGNPNFAISHFELNSEAPLNYSSETVRHFIRHYPNCKFYFLIGFDQVNNLDRWHEIEELAQSVEIVAVARPGYPWHHVNIKKYRIRVLECPEYDVSSTAVRTLHSLDIPACVLKYITDRDIYFAKTVRAYMSDKRYEHALSVAWLSYRIAVANHLDPQVAFLAGYLHDIAKEMDHDAARAIMETDYREYRNYPQLYYHQFLGEFLIKNYFKITDKRILTAVKFHTTGCRKMGVYAQILYAADKIDPTRNFDSTSLIDSMIKNCRRGFIEVLRANKEYYASKGYIIETPLEKECFEYYLKGK